MKYLDRITLYENKDSRINKLDNLTDDQKEEVKAFFRKHPEQEKSDFTKKTIDWNKSDTLTYENFKKIIDNFNERFLPKLKLSDLKEGEDYIYLGKDSYSAEYYYIKTYKASVAFASNNIGPEIWSPLCDWYISNAAGEETSWEENVIHDYPQKLDSWDEPIYGGAKWCISINHTKKFWDDYEKHNEGFVIKIVNVPYSSYEEYSWTTEYKVMFGINLTEKLGIHVVDIYNAWDVSLNKLDFKFELNFIKTNEKLKEELQINDYDENLFPSRKMGNGMIATKVGERESKAIFCTTTCSSTTVPFCSDRAFYACTQGLPKGEYYIDGQSFSFTLRKDVPVGGRLALNISKRIIFVIGKDGRTTLDIIPIVINPQHEFNESAKCLGKMEANKVSGNFLSSQEVRGGNANWSTSLIRQWLNSERREGLWWHPQDAWDCLMIDSEAYNFAMNVEGFLYNLDLDLSRVVTMLNTTYELNTRTLEKEAVVTNDRVWIPSLAELNISSGSNGTEEGESLEFWKVNKNITIFDTFGTNVSYFTRTRGSHIYNIEYVDNEGYNLEGTAKETLSAVALFAYRM